MTIDELIERLEGYREEIGGDAEVRFMSQPHWPFEYGIAGVASLEEIRAADDDGFDCSGNAEQAVYLVEGAQLGYGTKAAWEVVG